MRKAAQRASHTSSSSPRKKKKKKVLNSSTVSARMKKTLPCRPFLISPVTSALASSTSARTRVDICSAASRTSAPKLAEPGGLASVNGIELTVLPLRASFPLPPWVKLTWSTLLPVPALC
ncbi:Uncharacterised protein [Mycobacteroides abscessus subsp. abscessus]|nr:Uncharacterised protein [Mycobacteroides abscessus subsp. abscessus]